MGGVFVPSVNLDKLPLQHLPLWFQHWSSELFDFLRSAGNRQPRLGPLGWSRTRCSSTKGFLELDLVHGLCTFYILFLRKSSRRFQNLAQFMERQCNQYCGKTAPLCSSLTLVILYILMHTLQCLLGSKGGVIFSSSRGKNIILLVSSWFHGLNICELICMAQMVS